METRHNSPSASSWRRKTTHLPSGEQTGSLSIPSVVTATAVPPSGVARKIRSPSALCSLYTNAPESPQGDGCELKPLLSAKSREALPVESLMASPIFPLA